VLTVNAILTPCGTDWLQSQLRPQVLLYLAGRLLAEPWLAQCDADLLQTITCQPSAITPLLFVPTAVRTWRRWFAFHEFDLGRVGKLPLPACLFVGQPAHLRHIDSAKSRCLPQPCSAGPLSAFLSRARGAESNPHSKAVHRGVVGPTQNGTAESDKKMSGRKRDRTRLSERSTRGVGRSR
jgi:hypothetical protein